MHQVERNETGIGQIIFPIIFISLYVFYVNNI